MNRTGDRGPRIGFSPVFRRFLFASVLFAPLVIALHYAADLDDVTEFVLAAIALVPLAWLIGEATEHAAEHTGPGIGGFLNATFGNAPELIIALIAVHEGLTEVVRGSLTGSVIGNLLLVLGFSLAFGGRGELDRGSSLTSFALIALAILLFLIPAIPGWHGDPERHEIAVLSVPVSIVLLLVYVGVTWYSLRRHRQLHEPGDENEDAWSFPLSLGVLALATVATALVAEILVGSLETFADQVGPDRLLRRSSDRRDRRQRGRARRRGRRRASRQAEARRRDRALLERAGCRLPDPGRDAALVADRPARAQLPADRAGDAHRLPGLRHAPALERPVEPWRGIALVAAYGAVVVAFYLAGDRSPA